MIGAGFFAARKGDMYLVSIDITSPRFARTPAFTGEFRLVLVTFALFGFLYGIWQVVIADLQQALRLSEGELGTAITTGFLASFPMMLMGGRLTDRWGAQKLIVSTALMMALAFLSLLLIDRYWMLLVVLLVFFGASGAYDVGINAAAIHVEQHMIQPVMAYFHAAFSGTAAVSALVTGALLFLGIPFRLFYLIVAIVMASISILVWRSTALSSVASQSDHLAPAQRRGGAGLYRTPALLLLAAITALAFLSEGTLETWSAIYLRSVLDLPAIVGAAGPAILHSAMLVGRLGTARVVQQFGRRTLLGVTGMVTAVGMVLALATPNPLIILLGLLMAGLALAGVAPTIFSLAGETAPACIGEVSSVITTVGYSGFLIGPALIGGLAELIGLQGALAIIIFMGVLILILSLWVKESKQLA